MKARVGAIDDSDASELVDRLKGEEVCCLSPPPRSRGVGTQGRGRRICR
jgi:hypothetical protein